MARWRHWKDNVTAAKVDALREELMGMLAGNKHMKRTTTICIAGMRSSQTQLATWVNRVLSKSASGASFASSSSGGKADACSSDANHKLDKKNVKQNSVEVSRASILNFF